MASLPRQHGSRTDGLSHTSPSHAKMSPRLPRKSRQHGAYSSTSKLDNYTMALQVDHSQLAAYPGEPQLSPIPLTSPSSPFSSRPHRRDRGVVDRYGSLDVRQSHEHRSRDKFGSLDRTSAMHRYGYRGDGSLERGLESISHTGSLQRNRSLDRDYPLVTLGGRVMSEAADLDNEDLRYQQSQNSLLILSLQAQLVDLNKDFTLAQRELEQSKSQLNSYIASVKTFWSPELKKERALRKDETHKCQKNQEQLNATQQQLQILQERLKNQEERQSFQEQKDSLTSPNSTNSGIMSASSASSVREQQRQTKEIAILHETISEMELRIDIQKKTLGARDSSIKKLVEMLQTKNIPIETILAGEAEKDKMRQQIAQLERDVRNNNASSRTHSDETVQLNDTINTLKAELKEARANLNRANRESQNMDEVQALMDIKNTRITELEIEMKVLEKEITEFRKSSQANNDNQSLIEALHSSERILKSKIENMKVELSSKKTELSSLENRLDSVQSSKHDLEQTIDILNQKLSTKETNFNRIKHECCELEGQLRERDSELTKKNSMIENLKTDRLKLESDLADAKYDSEVSAKKLQLANKKLANSEVELQEKTDEANALQTRLATLSSDKSQNEALTQLEAQLSDKTKQLERLKQQSNESQLELQSQVDRYQGSNKELSRQVEILKQQCSEKQGELMELQESLSELKGDKLKLESKMNQENEILMNKNNELDQLRIRVEQLSMESTGQSSEMQKKIDELVAQAKAQSDQLQKYQSEIDRLLDILKEMESEKHNKDQQIKDVQDQLKEAKQKFINLKKQVDKKRAEENRKSTSPDTNGNRPSTAQKERIDELEEALKQSVKITARSEMNSAQLKDEIEKLKRQLEQYKNDVARATEISLHVGELEESLNHKNDQVRKLQAERGRHMEEVYEMKQEAILASISEKDSHIALLEASKTKNAKEEIEKLVAEKQRLNLRLKDLTTQRMLLVVEQSSENNRTLTRNHESMERQAAS